MTAEIQQMFDAFQEGGTIGGEQLQLCLQIRGLPCPDPPEQRLDKAHFTLMMQNLQTRPLPMQEEYRAKWAEAFEQLQENPGEPLDAPTVYTLLKIIAPDCSMEEIDDVLRQAGAKDGKVAAEALLDVLCK